MAAMSPGKRLSISAHLDVFCISTPRRSLRINPASRSALKCCDRVDFGIVLSFVSVNRVQVCDASEFAISAKIATRSGSDSACRIPSMVTFSIPGCVKGFAIFFSLGLADPSRKNKSSTSIKGIDRLFNSSYIRNYGIEGQRNPEYEIKGHPYK